MFSRYDRNVTRLARHALLFSLLFSSTGVVCTQSFAAYSSQDFGSVMRPQETRIDQLRGQEIQQLQVVLSRASAKEQEPDMLLRLAELYTERYRLLFYKETEIWQRKMDAFLQLPAQQQKATRKPKVDNGASKQWLGKAIQVLERITSLRRRYEKIDEVYYFLGFNNWELGRKNEAIRYFERITTDHPRSRYVTEAYRYIGDAAFASRNFNRALQAYRKAASQDTPARSRVLYGLAWSYFKLGENRKATEAMKNAIVTAKQAGSSLEQTGLGLQRDALDALALFYSESGDANNAASYFAETVGKNESVDILRKLASIYQRQGKYGKALQINKQLVDMGGLAQATGDDQRYTIMLDSIRVAGTKGDRNKEVALLKTVVSEFVVNAKSESDERLEQIRSMVRKSALLAHQEGNKSKTPIPAYARAEGLYRLYLSAFASGLKPEDVAEVHYLLADALSQQGKHQAAAAEYRGMMENSGDSAYGKYREQAALGLIFSLDAYFKDQKVKAISAKEADELISAIDGYVLAFPKNKDATKYLARAAGLLVTNKRMDEARPRLMQLIDSYPSSKEALDAAVLLVKDSEDRKDWQAAVGLSEKLLGNSALMAQDKKGELRQQLQAIVSRAKFKEVKDIEENQNFTVAAQKYEQLAAEATDREVRFKALNNAAVSYAKAGDIANELRIYQKIVQHYPDYDKAGKNILGAANENFLLGRYSDAADIFEIYYGLYDKRLTSLSQSLQKTVIEALRSAAFLREALGQREKASEDFRLLVNAANRNVGAAKLAAEDILFDAARRLQESGNGIEAVRSYQKYLSAFSSGKSAVEATLQIGVLYAKLQEDEKALNYYNATIAKVKSRGRGATPADLSHAAHARLLLLASLEETFDRVTLRLPEAQLKKDIAAKLAAMERLNKGYVEVVEFGDGAWAVEAFRRMAMVYRNFGEKLENAPVPKEFSPEDQAKFRAQLKAIAQPVFVKVGETLESALRKGESLLVAGPALAKVYLLAVLQSARPDRYPLIQEANWKNPADWIMGDQPSDEEVHAKRQALKQKQDDLAAWVAVGNWHLLRGEQSLAKIFYLRAADKNPKFVSAINNLAYLTGKDGNIQSALAGFRSALSIDEFAIAPKKNLARLYMASGLWRHANLAYRQLDVRVPSDREVKKGLGLSYLAIGKLSSAEPLVKEFTGGGDSNAQFANAIWKLAKGDNSKAKSEIDSLAASGNMYAELIQQNWTLKETNE